MDMDYVGDVRGQGLMLAVDLVEDKCSKSAFPIFARAATRVFNACVSRGLIVRPVGDRIILSPPLTLSREQVDDMVEILGNSLSVL